MTNSKQRLVIDANVFVSAVLSAQGKSRQAFDLAIASWVVLMSGEVFAELSEVLLRPGQPPHHPQHQRKLHPLQRPSPHRSPPNRPSPKKHHGIQWLNGKCMVHTPEFKRSERKFSQFQAAEAFLKKMSAGSV
jgi:hypothetical protein